MKNSKEAPTPRAVGLKLRKEDCSRNVNPTLYKRMFVNLMYLIATRPDMMHAISIISKFMETSKDSHS